jgi:hypothetical protein
MPEVTGMFVLRIINLVIEDIRDEIGKALSCNRQSYKIIKGVRLSEFCTAECCVGRPKFIKLPSHVFDNVNCILVYILILDTKMT